MMTTTALAACIGAVVTAAVAPQVLDLAVAPMVAVRQGEPVRLDVTITYRGDRRVPVAGFSWRRPCGYTLPAEWKPAPKEGMIPAQNGFSFGTLDPVDRNQMRTTIDLGELTQFDAPPGRYVLRMRAQLAVVSGPSDAIVGYLVSAPIDVPIQIIHRDAGKVAAAGGR